MIPQFFMRLDALPLTPNGKIDRKALPAPQGDETATPAYEPPRTGIEIRLAAIWQELLGVEAIGRDDNFFERGGHSLLATRASARLNDLLAIDLPLRAWFESPTLSALAGRIESTCDSEEPRSAAIEQVSRAGQLPLSHAQRRLWFLDQLEPGSSAYVMASASILRGTVDVDILGSCLAEIVRRHESLRTIFPSADGAPAAVLCESGRLPLTLLDLSDLPEAVRDERVRQLVEQNATRPFDLAEGPLYRIAIARLQDGAYLLLVAFHHIVFDFWSAGIFIREVTSLYEDFSAGRTSRLAALPVQFIDYAYWQARHLDGGGRERHLAYWREHVDADLPALALPADRPRSQLVRSGKSSIRVGPELARSVAAFSHKHNVSQAMTFLAVFQILLHRLSGQETLQVGMPVAGRDRPETADIIGFFINTVVVRSRFCGDSSFGSFLQHTRDAMLGALEHQDMPFEELVAALDPERDLTRTPLFQAFFNHINIEVPEIRIADATVETLAPFEGVSKFDVTLYVMQGDKALQLLLDYNAVLFDEDRMVGVMAQYVMLLEQLVLQPRELIGGFDLLDETARRNLPDPDLPLVGNPVHKSVGLALRQISGYGDRIAISSAGGDWSYRMLDERADRLAFLLLECGIGRGDVVALHARRDAMLVCAMLGVLRAGAAFAILDHAYPDSRLAETFAAARPRAMLHIGPQIEVGNSLGRVLEETNLDLRLHLSDDLFRDDHDHQDMARPEVGGNDLAYVAFTSGTTGGVKAIGGTHEPVAHFLDWQKDTFGFNERDRFSLISGLSHDPLLRDVFAPLWVGGTLCIPAPEGLDDPLRLMHWLVEQRVTVAHMTPARVQMLKTVADRAPAESLRYVFLGGETLRSEVVEGLRQISPTAACVNFYGATETPQAMSYHVVQQEEVALRERIPIGRGIDGAQLLVINAAGRLAGVGEPGEIIVRSPYLSLGYINDPALSAERFTSNPLSSANPDRVYRTGDLGRYLPDGSVDLFGRADEQVKLRGHRIEPGGIEAAICEHPSISAAAVSLHVETATDSRLIAYIVPDGTSPSIADIRKHLRSLLPDYMVPQQFVVLDGLPMTPNGKLDRKALARRQKDQVSGTKTGEPPSGATEALIAGIWKDVIGCGQVSRTDNFFDLGGHSMLAMKAIARIETKTGWRPDPRLLILENLMEIASQCDLQRPVAKRRFLSKLRSFLRVADWQTT
jgi:amino acid adenylation domain-containing protein